MGLSKKAFTLTEVLLGLAIIGTIAALSLPRVYDTLNKKILVTQLQSVITSFQQAVDNEMADKNTHYIDETGFKDHITGMDSVPCGSTCFAPSYKSLDGTDYDQMNIKKSLEGAGDVVKLKNGAVLKYGQQEAYAKNQTTISGGYGIIEGKNADGEDILDRCYGLVIIDVNGPDGPNIQGRDLFAFQITRKGRIVFGKQCNREQTTYDDAVTNCRSKAWITSCMDVLQRDSWTMKY